MVRLPENLRANPDAIKSLPIPLPPGEDVAAVTKTAWPGADAPLRYVPLSSVATIEIAPGPNQISRENGKRRVVVMANVRGRDLRSFVAEAQEAVAEKVKLPPGYWIGWGGQFEQLVSATKRLTIVVPVALLLIFLLLFLGIGSAADAAAGLHRRAAGADRRRRWRCWLRGIPLSITAGVGFIALSGVAVLNGLVIIAFIERLRSEGHARCRRGARRRADAAAAGADDGAGGVPRLRADGPRHRRRRRGAAAAGDGRDRRHHLLDHR